MGEDRGGRVCTFGLGFTPSDIYGPRVPAVEAREMENAEQAQWIAAEQRMVSMKERMGQMKSHMNQMIIYFQMFAQHGQPSSSFEFSALLPISSVMFDMGPERISLPHFFIITEKHGSAGCNVGEEGGFDRNTSSFTDGLDLVKEAIDRAGYNDRNRIELATCC